MKGISLAFIMFLHMLILPSIQTALCVQIAWKILLNINRIPLKYKVSFKMLKLFVALHSAGSAHLNAFWICIILFRLIKSYN